MSLMQRRVPFHHPAHPSRLTPVASTYRSLHHLAHRFVSLKFFRLAQLLIGQRLHLQLVLLIPACSSLRQSEAHSPLGPQAPHSNFVLQPIEHLKEAIAQAARLLDATQVLA